MSASTQNPRDAATRVKMTKLLILGANGSVARVAIQRFMEHTDAQLTLYVRDAQKLKHVDTKGARVVAGDVLDTPKLTVAIRGQDVVYANLAGDLERIARSVVTAMHNAGVTRLIWISSMGIYNRSARRATRQHPRPI